MRGARRRVIEVELAKRYLPPDLIKKKKQGFSSSLPYLLSEEFRLLYKTFLNDSHLVHAGHLNLSGINTLLSEHLSRKFDHGNRLWLLCNAEIWYRMYIENESEANIRELLDLQIASLPN